MAKRPVPKYDFKAFMACPKAAKSYKGTGLFAIIIHPTTFYCSFLCLDMLTQYLLLAKIIHIIAG